MDFRVIVSLLLLRIHLAALRPIELSIYILSLKNLPVYPAFTNSLLPSGWIYRFAILLH
jgi:hypothetical protein